MERCELRESEPFFGELKGVRSQDFTRNEPTKFVSSTIWFFKVIFLRASAVIFHTVETDKSCYNERESFSINRS